MNNTNIISVFIVETSIEYRDIFSKTMNDCHDIKIIGIAPSGYIALLKTKEITPDVILLDINIQDYPIIDFTKEILKQFPDCGIILTAKKGITEKR